MRQMNKRITSPHIDKHGERNSQAALPEAEVLKNE